MNAVEIYKLKKVYEEGGVETDFTDEELLFARHLITI